MTNIDQLYQFMRVVLRDKEVMGSYAYPDDDLLSAVRTVFACGEAPQGYALDGSIFTATAITPALEAGDDLALIVYGACLKLVVGEDGKIAYRTRSLSVADEGHRKRDLMAELKLRIERIEQGGGTVFLSWQSFSAFLGSDQSPWDFAEVHVNAAVPPTVSL